MKIITKVQIIAAFSFSMALILGSSIFLTVLVMEEEMEKNGIINDIVKDVFELNIVTYDYLMHHDERPKMQWQSKNDSITMLLTQASEKFKDPEEKTIIENMHQTHESLAAIFSLLVTTHEEHTSNGEINTTFLELEKRLTSQLTIKSQTMVSYAFNLSEISRAKVVTVQEGIILLTIIFILLMGGIMITALVWVNMGVLKPLIQFQKGTEIIANGDLDYQIGITKRDEIGELAKSFESMRISLKKTIIQLAGGVGHELRNPLGAIKNAVYFLNMILEEPEPDIKETLAILEKELVTAEKIISSLLDFARPKPLSLQNVDINDVVQKALSRITLPDDVKVLSQLDKALPSIQADPDQLTQVFNNIISNAIQAMPEGGQLVIKSEAPSPDWVTISIKDTGVGISEENLEKLFEPLFTTKAKGIGLGLAISKTLARGHRGNIDVKSEVGKGSTFTVKLPISQKEEK